MTEPDTKPATGAVGEAMKDAQARQLAAELKAAMGSDSAALFHLARVTIDLGVQAHDVSKGFIRARPAS